jgi:N-acetyl-anhydromuramyl-L-alanine amidase AmpD
MTPFDPTRINPYTTVRDGSPFHSDRVSGIRLIVIHCTDSSDAPSGDADLRNIGGWFSNPAAQVSAHRCVNVNGHTAVYVADSLKAWHCAAYNSAALGLEQIGHRATPWSDERHRKLVSEAARNVAQWSYRWHVPLRRGRVAGGAVLLSGIVTHEQLGSAGGNHDDPGPNYPMDRLIQEALYFKQKIKDAHATGRRVSLDSADYVGPEGA